MIIDAYATDTTPSHEVRRRALEALTNEGKPMQEVTYDALCKRLTQTAVEIQRLRAALAFYAEKNSWRHTVSLGHPQIDGTTSAALQDSGSIARVALGEKE